MTHAHLNLFRSRIMLHWILLINLFIRQILWILGVSLCIRTQMCHQFGRILFFLLLGATDVIYSLYLRFNTPLTLLWYGQNSMLFSHELFLDYLLATFIIWNEFVAWIGTWAMIIDGYFLIWWLIWPSANTAILFTRISGLGGNIILIDLTPFLMS